jgi:type IV secretion system protein VirB8
VKSVSPLGPHTALVRFETRRRDQAAQGSQPLAWAAVIGYRFSNEPLSVADRLLNPLGFQVVSYRRDAEAPAPPEPQADTTAADTTAAARVPAATAPAAASPAPAAVAQPSAAAVSYPVAATTPTPYRSAPSLAQPETAVFRRPTP